MPFLAFLGALSPKTWIKIGVALAIAVALGWFTFHERNIGASNLANQINQQNEEATHEADQADSDARKSDDGDGVRAKHPFDRP